MRSARNFRILLVSTIYIFGIFCDWQFFHVWWGSVRPMEFSIENFKKAPSWEALESCRKVDLYLVVDFYEIPVVKAARKKEVRDVIQTALLQQGILQPSSSVEVDAVQGPEASTEYASGSDPMLCSLSGVNSEDLKLAIQLKQLDLEIKRQEHTTQLLRFRQCELETQADRHVPLSSVRTQSAVPSSAAVDHSPRSPARSLPVPFRDNADFDISRHITLVPLFRDNEVDSYFGAFERIAAALRWPRETWSLLIQCKLTGKAKEVCSALSVSLKAYELVPEAYRQKFRSHVKIASQTYVEYAREKSMLFDKWCHSSSVGDFEQLRELILIEDFKNLLPDKIDVYLNEKKVSTLAEAAVCADEFTLTHKNVFVTSREPHYFVPCEKNKMLKSPKQAKSGEVRQCFYCHEIGHLMAMCPSLRKKNQGKSTKSVGFLHKVNSNSDSNIDAVYDPFICQGTISLSRLSQDAVPVTMLRDTGASQSFVLASVLPFSEESYCGSDVLIQGIELGVMKVPLHNVHIRSGLITGLVKLAVRHQLPVKGVSLIIGNDLAGEKVLPLPEVIENPMCEPVTSSELASEFPAVFSACVITRAQARKSGDLVDISDTFLTTGDKDENSLVTPASRSMESLSKAGGAELDSGDLSMSVDKF